MLFPDFMKVVAGVARWSSTTPAVRAAGRSGSREE